MKKLLPLALMLLGWTFAQVVDTPQQVYAAARTSLASLQAAIDDMINGNTPVARALDSDRLMGMDSSQFASRSELDGILQQQSEIQQLQSDFQWQLQDTQSQLWDTQSQLQFTQWQLQDQINQLQNDVQQLQNQ